MAAGKKRGPKKRGPSIADVAKLAGVSAQTVSRVSTGHERVLPETRKKVLAAMHEIGYSPNSAARALRVGKFGTIGLIAQQFDRTGEILTTASVIRAAESLGYSISIIQVSNPNVDELQLASSRLSQQAIDGLIVVRAGLASAASLALPDHLPVVVSDSHLWEDFPSVIVDQAKGTRDAVNHLLSLGHKNVYHVTGDPDSAPALDRLEAWQNCLVEAGIVPFAAWLGDWTARSGYEAGKFIAKHPEITAVYCANDETAFGLLRSLQEEGVKVPQDVSVVGFDSIALSEYSFPPLTTVKPDYDAMGRQLMQRLVHEIENGRQHQIDRTVVATELVVRGSTAPPPNARR